MSPSLLLLELPSALGLLGLMTSPTVGSTDMVVLPLTGGGGEGRVAGSSNWGGLDLSAMTGLVVVVALSTVVVSPVVRSEGLVSWGEEGRLLLLLVGPCAEPMMATGVEFSSRATLQRKRELLKFKT